MEKIHADVRGGLPLDEMIGKISHALLLYGHFRKDFLGNAMRVQTVKNVGGEFVLSDFDVKTLD